MRVGRCRRVGSTAPAGDALLARALRVPPSAVTVVRGERGRDKIVRIDGLALGEIEARVARLAEKRE